MGHIFQSPHFSCLFRFVKALEFGAVSNPPSWILFHLFLIDPLIIQQCDVQSPFIWIFIVIFCYQVLILLHYVLKGYRWLFKLSCVF
jgi:hypothetical protein